MPTSTEIDATPLARPGQWRKRLQQSSSQFYSWHIPASIFAVIHCLIFACALWSQHNKDNLTIDGLPLGIDTSIARVSALVLKVDVAVLILPICHTIMTFLVHTPLNTKVDSKNGVSLHKFIGWSILFFACTHTMAHWYTFAQVAAKSNRGFKGFFLLNLATGPGWTGHVMLATLSLMTITSLRKFRAANYERYWFSHHLFVLFFGLWSIHDAFCMIRTSSARCTTTGSSWQYWMLGALLYLMERALREVRGSQNTFISKVIQHPSNVVEIQVKSEGTKAKIGQHVYICCPEISIWQYRPFVLSSAPEEDFLSVHIHCNDNFTRRLADTVGCNFGKQHSTSAVIGIDHQATKIDVDPAIRKLLPPISIDGPFGGATEKLFQNEIVILVGCGEAGIMPLASILKSIWYRMNFPCRETQIRKVYLWWVYQDIEGWEWFRSLLMAIEAQDMDNYIEIQTCHADPVDNTNSSADVQDTMTGLRLPTKYGIPNWENTLASIQKRHMGAKTGFFLYSSQSQSNQSKIKNHLFTEDVDVNM